MSPLSPGHCRNPPKKHCLGLRLTQTTMSLLRAHFKDLGSLVLAVAGVAQFYLYSPILLVHSFEFQMQEELKSPPLPVPTQKTKHDSKPMHGARTLNRC